MRHTTESATVIQHNAPPSEADMSATTVTETLLYDVFVKEPPAKDVAQTILAAWL